MKHPFKIRLHTISPVHIGCGDYYEPTSFVIDKGKGKLLFFDPMDFIKSLSNEKREEFSNMCMESNLLKVFQFIKRNFRESVKNREVLVAKAVINRYEEIMRTEKFDKNTFNKFELDRTAYRIKDHLPFIPGSSLKGSIRTAWLSRLAEKKEIKEYWKDLYHDNPSDLYKKIGNKKVAKELEKKLLNGEFDTDPLRMLRISDLHPLNGAQTRILYAINKKKDSSKRRPPKGVPVIFEMITEGTVFEGVINLENPSSKSEISNPIEKKELIKAINGFFLCAAKKEDSMLKKLGIPVINASAILNKIQEHNKTEACLIRIGRHSGAEAVTVEGNRFIKIMQGKDKPAIFRDHATTIWFASDTNKPQSNDHLAPLGWAILEIGDMEADFTAPASLNINSHRKSVENIDSRNNPFARLKKQNEKPKEKDKKSKIGDRISGECFEEDGQLKLKITGNKRETVNVSGSYIPWPPGKKVKVRIEKISQDGRILKIRP